MSTVLTRIEEVQHELAGLLTRCGLLQARQKRSEGEILILSTKIKALIKIQLRLKTEVMDLLNAHVDAKPR